jgi:hypothetical protein
VPDVKPVTLLGKAPVPVPSVVFESAKVGLVLIDQQIPLAVTGLPPSAVIFPPETALVEVIDDIAAVVSVGTVPELVVNETSFPYEVPALFEA